MGPIHTKPAAHASRSSAVAVASSSDEEGEEEARAICFRYLSPDAEAGDGTSPPMVFSACAAITLCTRAGGFFATRDGRDGNASLLQRGLLNLDMSVVFLFFTRCRVLQSYT